MIIPEVVLEFIDKQADLNIGFNEVTFLKSHNVKEGQIG
jgi:hypothetical protein